MTTFGRKLKMLRQAAGFDSARSFADFHNFSPGLYFAWEGDRQLPSINSLRRLSSIFELDLGIYYPSFRIADAIGNLKGIICACGSENLPVTETRRVGTGSVSRRRRECAKCGERITTYELRTDSIYSLLNGEGKTAKADSITLLSTLATHLLPLTDASKINQLLKALENENGNPS